MTASEKAKEAFRLTRFFSEAVPGRMMGYYEFIRQGLDNASPLDPATLQLIVLCIGVAMGNEHGIYQHTKFFIDAGGTREALISGLTAAVMEGGGMAWGNAGKALEVFDEIIAEKNEKE